MRPVNWVRPEVAATAAVRGGLAFTGDDVAGTDAEEVVVDVHRIVLLVGERAGGRRRLADDDQGDDTGDRSDGAQGRPGQAVQAEMRRAVGHRAQHRHPVGLQIQQVGQQRRAGESDKRPGKPAVDQFADDHDGEHAQPDTHGPAVDQMQIAEYRTHPMHGAAAGAGNAQHVRQLMHRDDHCNPTQESADDGDRQELGDPPQPQQTDDGHHYPDRHGEDPDQRDIVGRSGSRQGCDADSEQRGDGRISADRHLRVRSQQRKGHRAGDERVEAGDRWHIGQPGGGQLFGYRDRQQRQRGKRVAKDPRTPIAMQRREQHRHIIATGGRLIGALVAATLARLATVHSTEPHGGVAERGNKPTTPAVVPLEQLELT